VQSIRYIVPLIPHENGKKNTFFTRPSSRE
jgi:hypothetical protein